MRRIPRHIFAAASCVVAVLGFSFATMAEPVTTSTATVRADTELQAYFSGNGLLNRGLFDLAAAEYRAFLKEHADHEKADLARYGLAVCLFRQNDLDDAKGELAKLHKVEGFTYAAEAAMMLGQCHLADGDYKKAISAFESVMKNQSEHALADDATAQLIESYYRDGQHERATRRHEEFVKRWPASPHAMRASYFAGLAALEQSDYAGALKNLEPVMAQAEQPAFAAHATLLVAQCHHQLDHAALAEQAYRRSLDNRDDPHRPDALLGLATLLQQQHKGEEAAKCLDELLTKHEAGPLVSSAWLLRGRVWFEAGQYEQAAAAFAKVRSDGKNDLTADAAYWSAKCLLRQNDYAGAARAYTKALAEYPEHKLLAEMRYDLGVAWFRAGELDNAVEALNTFRRDFLKHDLAADALHLLITIAHQQGSHDRCRDLARTFAKQHAEHPLLASVSFLIAESAYLAADYEQAAQELRDFIEKHAGNEQAETARFRLGMATYRLGRLDEAQALLSNLKRDGKTAAMLSSLNLTMGDILFQREDWAGAARHLMAFLNADTSDATLAMDDAILKLGIACQRQNKYEEALAQFERLAREHDTSPHFVQALFERGQVLVAMERRPDAITAFEQVLAKGSNSRFAMPARKHLAVLLLQKGDATGAAEQYDRIAKSADGPDATAAAMFQQAQALLAAREYVPAEKVYRRLLKRYPEFSPAAAKAGLAITLSRQDKHDDALRTIAEVNLADLDAALADSMRYEQAWCLRETNKPAEATKAYRELILSKPERGLLASALLEVAQIEATQGQYREAITALQQLRQLDDATGVSLSEAITEQAMYCLGTSLFQVEEYPEAAKVLGEFIDGHAKSKLRTSARFFRGEALFKLGKHGEAVQDFESVTKAPDGGPAVASSLLRLGECYAAQQRWARSEEAFTEYLEKQSAGEQWFQARFGLGWARENQGRYAEAMAAYREVVQKHEGPTAARAQFQIGQCLFAQKQYEDAVRELLKVDILYAYPQWSAAAIFEAGRCFETLSKSAEAKQQFEIVIEKYGDTHWAEMAKAHLVTLASAPLPGRE